MYIFVSCMLHLFDRTDRGDMVGLTAPLVIAVVLSPVGHVPHVLTAPEVVMLVSDPSVREWRWKRTVKNRYTQQQEKNKQQTKQQTEKCITAKQPCCQMTLFNFIYSY